MKKERKPEIFKSKIYKQLHGKNPLENPLPEKHMSVKGQLKQRSEGNFYNFELLYLFLANPFLI